MMQRKENGGNKRNVQPVARKYQCIMFSIDQHVGHPVTNTNNVINVCYKEFIFSFIFTISGYKHQICTCHVTDHMFEKTKSLLL